MVETSVLSCINSIMLTDWFDILLSTALQVGFTSSLQSKSQRYTKPDMKYWPGFN